MDPVRPRTEIQFAVMEPSIVKGEARDSVLFSMYNPHGVFIALEDVGYLLLGVTFFFTALAVATGERLQRAVRILWLVSSALAISSQLVLGLAIDAVLLWVVVASAWAPGATSLH